VLLLCLKQSEALSSSSVLLVPMSSVDEDTGICVLCRRACAFLAGRDYFALALVHSSNLQHLCLGR